MYNLSQPQVEFYQTLTSPQYGTVYRFSVHCDILSVFHRVLVDYIIAPDHTIHRIAPKVVMLNFADVTQYTDNKVRQIFRKQLVPSLTKKD